MIQSRSKSIPNRILVTRRFTVWSWSSS